eukprot:comp78087_c0_seq1/m.48303 comp78087_c0_seq1/g.48303  ORF comp78087_c0_seq1/g.48303 comp78087_c0_seq1/m.48303 type:complete len:260 (-) comp78087_c0_seq1:236-1015(-)
MEGAGITLKLSNSENMIRHLTTSKVSELAERQPSIQELRSPAHSSDFFGSSTTTPPVPTSTPQAPFSTDTQTNTSTNDTPTTAQQQALYPPLAVVRTVLVPPMNFAMVAPGVYRSGYPGKKNEPFLRKLGLRSIICLTPEPYRNYEFAREQNIQIFQYPIEGNKEPFTHVPESMVGDAIAKILDKRNHPLLIHCNKGKHRAGCVVGCLRKVQNWSTTFIFDEYQRFAGTKVRILDQEFIELFNIHNIQYDESHKPLWLW